MTTPNSPAITINIPVEAITAFFDGLATLEAAQNKKSNKINTGKWAKVGMDLLKTAASKDFSFTTGDFSARVTPHLSEEKKTNEQATEPTTAKCTCSEDGKCTCGMECTCDNGCCVVSCVKKAFATKEVSGVSEAVNDDVKDVKKEMATASTASTSGTGSSKSKKPAYQESTTDSNPFAAMFAGLNVGSGATGGVDVANNLMKSMGPMLQNLFGGMGISVKEQPAKVETPAPDVTAESSPASNGKQEE